MLDAYEILNSLTEVIYIADAETDKIIYINKPCEELLGSCIGNTRSEALSDKLTIHSDKEIYKNKSGTTAQIYSASNGIAYAVYSNTAVIDGKNVIICTAADISGAEAERKELKRRLKRRERSEKSFRIMSYTDTLTGIYNRNKFIDDCEEMSSNGETNAGVMFMDLNGLKEINDKHGHYSGDEALKCIADIIAETFGEKNVYRVGGDEFVAICRDTDENSFNALVERLLDELKSCEYKAAVGSKYAGEGCDINEVIKIADEDMYRDKKYFYRNAGQSRRYRAKTDTFTAISTPEKIKNLIHDERFVIWFQPRFSVEDGEFSGSEALVRFFGEDDMIISPLDFIPEMEDNNTIHLVDLYVFKHVCEYISGWIKNGKKVKPVSMNMSHATLRKPNIIENLMDIWYDHGFPKELIVIEVSEDQENGGISDITNVLAELKKCGFSLAIDNFGAKYADLYLFADFRFDILKLDGDMVYKIETDRKTQLLSTSIMQICHDEDIKIVAAGVENEKEIQVLKEIGCDEAQGYYYEKPMSWNKFEEKYL